LAIYTSTGAMSIAQESLSNQAILSARTFCREHKCPCLYSETELELLCRHIEQVRYRTKEIHVVPVACDQNRDDLVIEFAHDHLLLATYDLHVAKDQKLQVIGSNDAYILCDESAGRKGSIQLDVKAYKRTREFGMSVYKTFP